jgi:hypothetical protein
MCSGKVGMSCCYFGGRGMSEGIIGMSARKREGLRVSGQVGEKRLLQWEAARQSLESSDG